MPGPLHGRVVWRLGKHKWRETVGEAADERPELRGAADPGDAVECGCGQKVPQEQRGVEAAEDAEYIGEDQKGEPVEFIEARPVGPVGGEGRVETGDGFPEEGGCFAFRVRP